MRASLFALVFLLVAAPVDAQPRIDVGASVGFLVAGDKIPTGGVAFAPAVHVTVPLRRWLDITAAIEPYIVAPSSAAKLGLVGIHGAGLAIHPVPAVSVGVSAEAAPYWMRFCTGKPALPRFPDGWCKREPGMAPGVSAAIVAALSRDERGRGASLTLSARALHADASAWQGWMLSALGGGSWSF